MGSICCIIPPKKNPNNHYFCRKNLIFCERCTNRLHHGRDLAGAGALSFTKASLGPGARWSQWCEGILWHTYSTARDLEIDDVGNFQYFETFSDWVNDLCAHFHPIRGCFPWMRQTWSFPARLTSGADTPRRTELWPPGLSHFCCEINFSEKPRNIDGGNIAWKFWFHGFC